MAALYDDFLGTWTLDPESCNYEQSEAPREGTCRIEREGESLRFLMHWVDAEGQTHQASFSGIPDGVQRPFEGGELADAMSVSALSKRELNTSAFYRGREVMIAQRQLDASGRAMRITQVVRFLDNSTAANVGVYRKNLLA